MPISPEQPRTSAQENAVHRMFAVLSKIAGEAYLTHADCRVLALVAAEEYAREHGCPSAYTEVLAVTDQLAAELPYSSDEEPS